MLNLLNFDCLIWRKDINNLFETSSLSSCVAVPWWDLASPCFLSFLRSDLLTEIFATKENSNASVFDEPEAILTIWILRDNGTKVDGKLSSDPVAENWEDRFVEAVLNETLLPRPNNSGLFVNAEKSPIDEIDGAVNSNMLVLALGSALILVYIALVLGKFDALRQRILLSLMGIAVIGLATSASYGFCFYCGFFYGSMHPIIPFLLLGIGVDDMFVIVKVSGFLTIRWTLLKPAISEVAVLSGWQYINQSK